jgi:hypothetical protein
MDIMNPSASLLCKLGSIVVHASEFASSGGHAFDKAAIDTLMADAEVTHWLEAMDAAALLPKTRASRPLNPACAWPFPDRGEQ